MTSARDLAGRFHRRWLDVNPFAATMYGIPGYDDLVPDESAAGQQAWRAEAARFIAEADELAAGPNGAGLSLADAITLGCTRQAALQDLEIIDAAPEEHTVTAMQYAGPATFLAIAARTVLTDTTAAEAYLTRLRRSGGWIDQVGERLREGAAQGRLPVAPLVEQAITWAGAVLSAPEIGPVLVPEPPPGWARTAAWEQERRTIAEDVVRPALARWVALVRELLPRGRPSERAGLTYLPGGDEDYARSIRVYTTLPLSPAELHQTGLDQIAALEARAAELGKGLGFTSLEAVFGALRDSAGKLPAAEALRQAAAAVQRAEGRAAEIFPEPLPPPCAVTPMPEVVATSGAAPHYTAPRLDGGRPGTFWFNTRRPTAGTGWDIEAVAFHEAVPGHHLQLSRLQLLAEETGLYADDRGLLGSITASLMRAARLVVDTGMHAFGWSRERALEFMAEHVPMPRAFLAGEIDRYVVMPGQALAYLTGKLEILRIREEARRRLGPAFSLPAFHAAVLDHGSLPMPVLARSIDGWLGQS